MPIFEEWIKDFMALIKTNEVIQNICNLTINLDYI